MGYEERLPHNTVKMSQDRKQNQTVSFAGHKCEKLQKGLYDTQSLERISRQLETAIEELYQEGYNHFIYSTSDKFGILASERVNKFAEQHAEVTLSTLPDDINSQYYNLIKYFIENSAVIVYCDGEKEEPKVVMLNK